MKTKLATIDLAVLDQVTGGVLPGPNGEGCTGPFGRPFPRPPTGLPGGQPPFQIPGENQPLR